MSRSTLFVCLVACFAAVALAGDRTLGTVSGLCKDQFNAIMKEHYGADKECADAIRAAMTTAPKSPADCPGKALADAGSNVQKCMSKTQKSKDAWTSFIKACEILNVNERTGAGEAEAANKAQPSCFPRFDSLAAFKNYLEGSSSGSKKTSAAGSNAAGSALLAAAAAAGLYFVL